MMKAARAKPSARLAFPTIILLFLGSFFLRIGEDQGFAFARDTANAQIAMAAQTAEDQPVDEEALGMLIARLRAREADLTRREAEIAERSETLDRLSSEVDTRLDELARAEETLRQTMALANRAAEDDLERLTKVYESMKPKDAAALFETMEIAFAAGFLGRMKPASAAAIMSGLQPNTAYAISLTLSGRNVEAPTQ